MPSSDHDSLERDLPVLRDLDAGTRARVLDVLRPFSPHARRMSGMERLNTLLSVPHPEVFVPALPTEELYLFIQDVGLEDCAELVQYASEQQLVGFVDLGCWARDTFSLERFARWLDALQPAGHEATGKLVSAVDPELLALAVLRTARIYDTREAPEDVGDERVLVPSPDGAYMIEMDAEDERQPILQSLLQAVYAQSPVTGRRLLEACRWELPAQLEEQCYQWRVGRLEDMGFLPFEEAVEMEREIDLTRLDADVAAGLAGSAEPEAASQQPRPFAGWVLARVEDGPLLSAVLDELADGAPRERFLEGFMHLVNRRLAVRGLDLGEWAVVEEESAHAFRVVSVGLELLSRGARDPRAVLERVSLLALYQAGRTTLSRLRRRAVDLTRAAALVPRQTPFDAPLDLWLDGLRADPPLRLASPPAAAKARRERRDLFAPFRTLAEVDEAARIVAGGEAVLAFFRATYGYGPGRLAEADLAALTTDARTELRFSALFLTGLANRVLGRAEDLTPLYPSDVRDFVQMVFVDTPEGRHLDPRLAAAASAQLAVVTDGMDVPGQRALDEFVTHSLGLLDETLQGLAPAELPDVRFLGGVLLTIDV